MFFNNSGRQGGAISAYSSNLYFAGDVVFTGNLANNGGAISLKEGAVININDSARIVFQANAASMYGGAIYVADAEFLARNKMMCFVHYHDHKEGYVEFDNNTAKISGAALFGGWIDLCVTEGGKNISNIFDFQEENSVASNPT